jgi:hypothetical protein
MILENEGKTDFRIRLGTASITRGIAVEILFNDKACGEESVLRKVRDNPGSPPDRI